MAGDLFGGIEGVPELQQDRVLQGCNRVRQEDRGERYAAFPRDEAPSGISDPPERAVGVVPGVRPVHGRLGVRGGVDHDAGERTPVRLGFVAVGGELGAEIDTEGSVDEGARRDPSDHAHRPQVLQEDRPLIGLERDGWERPGSLPEDCVCLDEFSEEQAQGVGLFARRRWCSEGVREGAGPLPWHIRLEKPRTRGDEEEAAEHPCHVVRSAQSIAANRLIEALHCESVERIA